MIDEGDDKIPRYCNYLSRATIPLTTSYVKIGDSLEMVWSSNAYLGRCSCKFAENRLTADPASIRYYACVMKFRPAPFRCVNREGGGVYRLPPRNCRVLYSDVLQAPSARGSCTGRCSYKSLKCWSWSFFVSSFSSRTSCRTERISLNGSLFLTCASFRWFLNIDVW